MTPERRDLLSTLTPTLFSESQALTPVFKGPANSPGRKLIGWQTQGGVFFTKRIVDNAIMAGDIDLRVTTQGIVRFQDEIRVSQHTKGIARRPSD